MRNILLLVFLIPISFLNAQVLPTPTLSWTASTSPNVVGYNLYRSSVSGGPYTIINTSIIQCCSFNDVNVVNKTNYYYVATAIDNNNNQSIYSNEAVVYCCYPQTPINLTAIPTPQSKSVSSLMFIRKE